MAGTEADRCRFAMVRSAAINAAAPTTTDEDGHPIGPPIFGDAVVGRVGLEPTTKGL